MEEKKESAIELAASLAFAAMRNNDNIGLALFTSKVEKFIPLRKGRRHVLRMIRELIYFEPKNKTSDLNETLKFVSRIIKKRSIIFLISDFMYEDNYIKTLKILKTRNDVIAINIKDIREQEIPDIGYIELEDEETGEQVLVDTSDADFRREYVKLINHKKNIFKTQMSKLKIDSIQLLTNQPFEVPLRQFFNLRMKRI